MEEERCHAMVAERFGSTPGEAGFVLGTKSLATGPRGAEGWAERRDAPCADIDSKVHRTPGLKDISNSLCATVRRAMHQPEAGRQPEGHED